MIRGAIFDVDGTLLDSMPIRKDAGEKYLMAKRYLLNRSQKMQDENRRS